MRNRNLSGVAPFLCRAQYGGDKTIEREREMDQNGIKLHYD